MEAPDGREREDGDSTFLLKSMERDDEAEYEYDGILGVEGREEVPLATLSGEKHSEGGLGRHLGLLSTSLLIINTMIGTGIFSTPSSVVAGVGSVGAALLLWVLGFAIAFCGLFVWFEFGCLFPRSGGEKVYLEAAYPRPRYLATTLFAIQAVLLSSPAGGCIVFAENLVLASGHAANDVGKRMIGIGVIFLVTVIHSFAPRWGVRLLNILGTVKIFILIFIVLTGLSILIVGISTVPDPYVSFRSPFAGSSKSSYDYALALLKVIYTYAGWNNASYVLNEVRNPVQTLKIAGPLGLGTVGTLYLFANVAYFTAATTEELGNSGVTVAALFLGKVFGDGARRVAGAFVAISALGNIMTSAFSSSRVDQELAKEGMLPFPRFLATNWPSGSPSASLFLICFYTSFIIVVIPFGDAYNFILDVMGYPNALISFMVTLGLLILRRKAPELRRPFKVWLPLAFLFMAAQVFLIITPFVRPINGKGDTRLPYWLPPVTAMITLVCGLMYWILWRIALPFFGRYSWLAKETHLQDGTSVMLWTKITHSGVRIKDRIC